MLRVGDARIQELHGELGRYFRRRAPDEAEDLVQETFVRVAQGLPALRDHTRLGPWVGRVARNVWVDHLRRLRPTEELGELEVEQIDAESATELVAGWLPHFVSALPEPYAEAVRLADLEGVPQAELARRLGISPSGARSRVQRGRRLVREALEACCAVSWSEGEVVDVRAGCSC